MIVAVRNESVRISAIDDFTTPVAKMAAQAALLDKTLDKLDGSSVGASKSMTGASRSAKDFTIETALADEKSKRLKESLRAQAKASLDLAAGTTEATRATKEFSLEAAMAEEKTARLRKQFRDQAKATLDLEQGVDSSGEAFRRNGDSINQLTGRIRLLAEAGVLLGPALIPIGVAAVPAIAGLAVAFTAAAAGAGVALMAFKGVGDALKSIDAYQLEPTVANLQAMRAELDSLGPAGADFARYIDSLGPQLGMLQDVAREGLLPGVEEGIGGLMSNLPQLQRIVFNLATAMGNLSESAGEGVSGGFLDYLESDAGPALESFGQTLGNITKGFGGLLVALAPLSRSFSTGFEEMAASFAEWAAGVGETQGFRDFVSYVQQSAPQVLDLLGSLGNAIVGIAQAVAPVGAVVLPVLTGIANALGAIGSSPIGPVLFSGVAGLVAINRAAIVANATMGLLGASAGTTGGKMAALGKSAGIAGGIGALAVSLQSTNEAMGSLGATAGGAAAGFSVGGPWGAAIGGAIGLAASLATSNDDAADRVAALSATFDQQTGAITANTEAMVAKSLQDGGVLDAADQLGISTSLVTAAVTGNAAAQRELNAALAGYDVNEAAAGTNALAFTFGEQERQAIKTNDAAVLLRGTVPGLAGDFSTASQKAEQLAAAMGGNANAAGEAGGATETYAEATRGAADAAEQTRTQIAGLVTAMREQRSAALAAFDAQTQYAQALKTARDRAAESNDGLRSSTEAGRANRDVISGLAGAWNSQSKAVKNNADRYRDARGQFVQVAHDLGITEKAAKGLADRLLEVPKQVVTKTKVENAEAAEKVRAQTNSLNKLAGMRPVTKIDADNQSANSKVSDTKGKAEAVGRLSPSLTIGANVGNALGGISAVQSAINSLQNKTITLTTIRSEIRRGNVPLPGAADGGSVPKDGGPYADRFLYMLAPGEEIVSNRRGQADAFRADRAAGRIPGYADGGTTGLTAAAQKWAGATSPKAASERDSGGNAPVRSQGKEIDKMVAKMNKAGWAVTKFAFDLSVNGEGLSSALEKATEDYDRYRDLFKDAGLVWSKSRKEEAERIKGLARNYDSLNERLKNSRDAQAAFASEVGSVFNNDIFGNGVAGLSTQLQADSNDTAAFQAALQSAVNQGLDGGFRDALFRSGDLNTAQQLAASGAGGIASYEAQFNQRGAQQSQLGSFAGNVGFGAEVASNTAEVAREMRELRREVKRLEGAVERGARDGSREGSRDGSREGTRGANQDRQTQTAQNTQTTSRGGRNGRGR